MEMLEAHNLAMSLMDQHHLREDGWAFRFSRAKRTLGTCDYRHKTLRLSAYFVNLNEPSDVRDVILHEIAHALTEYGENHGPKWKAQARKIGANPRATKSNVETPPGKYHAQCPKCGVVGHAHRRPKYAHEQGAYKCTRCNSTITWMVLVKQSEKK